MLAGSISVLAWGTEYSPRSAHTAAATRVVLSALGCNLDGAYQHGAKIKEVGRQASRGAETALVEEMGEEATKGK